MLLVRRQAQTHTRAVEFLTLSCVNYGFWVWLLVPLFQNQWIKAQPMLSGLLLALIAFVSPVALALLIAKLQQTQWIGNFLGRFGFNTINPIPTAWDYQFTKNDPNWVVVTLKDGSKVFGFYGLKSFTGDEPGHRDIFLEAVFEPTETGEWAPVEDTAGVWISADQLAIIEFRKVHELSDATES